MGCIENPPPVSLGDFLPLVKGGLLGEVGNVTPDLFRVDFILL
ncbi:MAG: hypothetical protein ACOYXN_03270 [Acidobacteriota bacterium]